MEYVTPEYEQQLNELAKELVTPERFGKVALRETVQRPVQPILDLFRRCNPFGFGA